MTDQCNFKIVVSLCDATDTFRLIFWGESDCDRTSVLIDQILNPDIPKSYQKTIYIYYYC